MAGEAARLKLAGERKGFLDLPDRPLTIALGPRDLAFEDGTALRGTAFVRLFAMGVASVRYEVPIPAGSGRAASLRPRPASKRGRRVGSDPSAAGDRREWAGRTASLP